MRQHMGAHLLEADWSQYKQPGPGGMAWSKPTIPCPLCGVRECVAQEVIDVSAIGNGNKCTAFINGKKAVHICRRVGKQEYTLGPAANSNAEGPCTNRPVKCEHCSTLLLDSAVLLDGGALPEVAWHGGDEHEAKEGGGARGARA